MNQFEFLRYVNLGQYLPTNSWIHRLDVRARILAAVFLLLSLTLTGRPVALLIAMFGLLVLLSLARIPWAYAFRNLLPPLPFLLLLAVLQVFFNPRPVDTDILIFRWHWISVSMMSLLAGVTLLLRFSALILTLSLATYCISTSEMIHGLESLLSPLQRVGIPTRMFVMMIQVMLRFLPFLALAAERIAKAQASRGAQWGSRRGSLIQRARQVVPLLVPLFLTGLHRAENLALAMEARGYDSESPHTSLFVMHFSWRDATAIIMVFVFSLALLLV
ncbi:MAG: energy-coupling factor transporter transmembrane component T [Anaerolineales bacterium]